MPMFHMYFKKKGADTISFAHYMMTIMELDV